MFRAATRTSIGWKAIAISLVLPLAAACGDSSGPEAPEVTDLKVSGIRVDEVRFRQNGEFELGLLALDNAGKSILNQNADISATLTEVDGASPTGYSIASVGASAESPQNKPTFAAILLDNSGSMSSSDPNEMRADAAQLFWEAVLPVNSANRVSFLDFGAGSTDAFSYTRLLQTWTADQSALEAQLAEVGPFGGTPLYESVEETANWIASSTTASSTNRVLLVLSDGQPNSTAQRESAIAAANAAGITIHTVGLGPASDAASNYSTAAVAAARELAERGGGVYSSATDAFALASIFQTLAQVSGQGQLVGVFKVSPTPPSGSRVSGTVTVGSGGGTASANWSFIAP